MQDLKLVVLGVITLVVVLFLWVIGGIIQKDFRCFENVEDRPCLEDTIESNGGDTCECKTAAGKIEWQVCIGCDAG